MIHFLKNYLLGRRKVAQVYAEMVAFKRSEKNIYANFQING